MKKIVCLLAAAFFTFSFVSAQTNKNRLPAKPSEQSEIKSDKHLEKEMQQKQLSSKPERLEQEPQAINKVEPAKKNSAKPKTKDRYVKHKHVKKS